MNKFTEIDNKYKALIEKYRDFGPLMLRIGATAPGFTALPYTAMFSSLFGLITLVASVSIILGFYFRFGCLLMIVAYILPFVVRSIEFDSSFNVLRVVLGVIPTIGLLLVGPGKYSIDNKSS
ncbi:MAG: hypothetical protein HY606_01260 [Planctomycetes bacterium]|nr:hypothetical protein [Planctomycetota bacterium]